MTVCETCGDEGYTHLLFYCLKCQIIAVHRYCMDGPSTIDDEEISWYCEQCVPRVLEPPEPSRKCERVGKTINRLKLRRKARKEWKNSLSLLQSKTPDTVKDSDVKVTDDPSSFNLESNKDGVPGEQENSDEKITQPKQVLGNLKTNASQHDPCENIRPIVCALKSPKPCENNGGPVKGRCKRALVIGKKKDLLAHKIVRKIRTKRASTHDDVEDEQVKLVTNVVVPVSDNIVLKEDKREKSRDEVDYKFTGEVNDSSNSHATKHSVVGEQELEVEEEKVDSKFTGEVNETCNSQATIRSQEPEVVEEAKVDSKFTGEVKDTCNSHATKCSRELEVVEEAKVSVGDHEGEDVESCCTIRKPCSSMKKKKRSLIIEMEYSDDNDDDRDDPDDHDDDQALKSCNDDVEMLCTSSSKPRVELDSDRCASSMKGVDHNLTPSAPLKLGACVPYPPCISHIVDHVPSQPVVDVIWRGDVVISNNIDPTSFELEAHVSNKASPVVYGAAIALPKTIEFDIISKRFAWPKSFRNSPPTSEIIGLYLFPVGERDEIFYQNLMVKMVDRQLMLMAQINNLELLVFCSHELPEEERRFQRNYYLWGVFRSKQETTSSMKPSPTQVTNSYISLPTNMSKDVHQTPRDSNHKTLSRFAESPNPDNLNHPKRPSTSQIDRDQHYGSHKRRYHHETVHKYRNHRPESDGYEYDDTETSYQFEVQRRKYRIRGHDAITIRTVQKDSYRSRGHYRHYRGRERYD